MSERKGGARRLPGSEPSRNGTGAGAAAAPAENGTAPTEVVIERPDLQSKRERIFYSAATAVAWGLWMYLWLPAITLVAWIFGVRRFVDEIVVPNAGAVATSALVYLGVVVALGGGLILWSRYNLRRFGSRSRRKSAPRVTDEDLRRYFSLSRGMLADARHSRSVVIHHDPSGMVVEMEPAEEGSAAGV